MATMVVGVVPQDGKDTFSISKPARLHHRYRFPSRRPSPSYENGPPRPPNDDSEARSVFVSQLAARMAAKDLGYFFEEHLGEGSVIDPRIVTDRLSRRSKGLAHACLLPFHTNDNTTPFSIAYVELASIDFVQKAIDLSGTVVMGLPIKVQLTEAERNKLPSTSDPCVAPYIHRDAQQYLRKFLHIPLGLARAAPAALCSCTWARFTSISRRQTSNRFSSRSESLNLWTYIKIRLLGAARATLLCSEHTQAFLSR